MAEVDASIYKNAVSQDPGEVQNKLLQNLTAQQGLVQGQQAIQANQIELATKRFGMINGAAAGVIGDPDFSAKDKDGNLKDLTPKLWDTLGRLTNGDAMTAQHAIQFMQQFPDGSTPMGLAQQRDKIKAVLAQTLGPWERGKAYLGETRELDTGGGKNFVGAPAFGGPVQDRGYVANTLQPGTTQTNPKDLSQNYVGGIGRPPLQGLSGAAPAAASAGAPRSIMAAPPPGAREAAVATGAGSGEALAQARNRSLNYKQEVFPLEQAIPALEKLGKTGTGPGTEELNHVKSFLQSAGIPGIDTEKIKTFDEAKKYLTDFVNQNGNSGTNDKLAAAFAGNPSVNISNAAATDVAKSALSLRRMKQAQLVEFEKSGKPDDQYAKFASQWNASHDPRAYGFDLMTTKQRKEVLASLPEGKNGVPGPRDRFKLQVEAAHQGDIIRAPQ